MYCRCGNDHQEYHPFIMGSITCHVEEDKDDDDEDTDGKYTEAIRFLIALKTCISCQVEI